MASKLDTLVKMKELYAKTGGYFFSSVGIFGTIFLEIQESDGVFTLLYSNSPHENRTTTYDVSIWDSKKMNKTIIIQKTYNNRSDANNYFKELTGGK